MLIHTYLTDGFYDFGKIFIETFKKFHGEELPMVVTTRNLNKNQIDELKRFYKNIIVLNKKIDMKHLSRLSKLDVPTLLKYKNEIEYDHINRKGNVIWKQYISVEDRYRNSIVEAMQYAGNEKFMMHIDADSFVKQSLDPIFNLIEKNDITFIFRLKRPKVIRKIFGTLSGYRICEKTNRFMKTWIKYIDRIPLVEKPIGYGQASCYYAYNELSNSNIKWGKIPRLWVSSQLNKELIIWSGNHSRGKTKTVKLFKSELRNNINDIS